MNKRVVIGVCIAFFLALSVWTVHAEDKPILLKLGHHVPEIHTVHRDICAPWAKLVEKNTGGQVKITIFSGGALGGAKEQWDMAVHGRCDISWGHQAHFPGLFPLTSVIELPFLGFESGEKASEAAWKLYEKFPAMQSEYAKVKVLFIHAGAPFELHMIKGKEIYELEDFKGRKLRAPGDIAVKIYQCFGATPVGMPAPDIYLSLERGVIDGTLFNMDSIEGFKLVDVTHQHIVANFYSPMYFLIMNLETWKRLPPGIQKKIDEVSGAYGASFAGRGWDSAALRGLELAKKERHEIYQVPKDKLAKWQVISESVYKKWLEEMEGKSLPGRQILEEARRLAER